MLDFAGIVAKSSESEPNSWDTPEHVTYQKILAQYLELAEAMFSADGLNDSDEHLWQRALLSLGNYLLPSGRNRSFLANSMREEASWKRLLSGSSRQAITARDILKRLFGKLSSEMTIAEQLKEIIEGAEHLRPWRDAIVYCPAAFDYCKRNSIRVDEKGTIYLLKRSQMNGAHAELFTFCLHKELQSEAKNGTLAPLELMDYCSVNETAIEPGIIFAWADNNFKLEGGKDGFVLYRSLDRDENRPPFVDFLVEMPGFTLTENRLERKCSYSDIRSVINELRNGLTEFIEGDGQNA